MYACQTQADCSISSISQKCLQPCHAATQWSEGLTQAAIPHSTLHNVNNAMLRFVQEILLVQAALLTRVRSHGIWLKILFYSEVRPSIHSCADNKSVGHSQHTSDCQLPSGHKRLLQREAAGWPEEKKWCGN